MIASVVDLLVRTPDAEGPLSFLGSDVTLVPAPRRAPLLPGSLWPGRRVCEELLRKDLGADILPCLRRAQAVDKSATAAWGQRPNAMSHYDSMEVQPSLLRPECIVVVDDVITKGATLIAAISRVQEAFPDADVRGFALVRTIGLQPDITEMVDPCVGVLRWDGVDVRRQP
jgi:hypothetical protein